MHTLRLRVRTHRWMVLLVLGLGALLPAGVALAAGDSTGCDDIAPAGWFRTIWWVDGQSWTPGQTGPWANNTTISVRETNARGTPCDSSGPGEAYQDGQPWWGTFRQDWVTVARGQADPSPYGRFRFTRDSWWSGWTRPAIGRQKVAGYYLKSQGPSAGSESVFVANDSEVWIELGSFSVEARCMSATGPLVSVAFSARNASTSWSASTTGTNWSPNNVPGPGPWTVTASGYGWAGSATLSDGGSTTFVITGCGSAGGTVSIEAHCGSASGPLTNAGAFDAWEANYWTTPGRWYASTGYGASATFSVPVGATTPITVRIWWSGSNQQSATVNVGEVARFVTTDPALCSTPTAVSGPTPTPPPAPCTAGAGPLDPAWIQVSANVPNGMGSLYGYGDGVLSAPPNTAVNSVNVVPGQPLTVNFGWNSLAQAYEPDHAGVSAVTYGIRDVTTNTVVFLAEHDDEKELRDSAGVIRVWGRSLRVKTATVAGGVTIGGPSDRYKAWMRNWATWDLASSTPSLNKYLFYNLDSTTTATFTPINGHTYDAFAMAGHGACQVAPNFRWSRLLINARQMSVALIEVGLDGTPKGPLANFPLQYFAYDGAGTWIPNAGTSDAQGTFTWTYPMDLKTAIAPGFEGYDAANVAARGWVLWKADHACGSGTNIYQTGTYKGFWGATNPCTATLYYARIPTITATARREDTGAALANVPIALTNANGDWLRNQTTDGAGNTTFTFSESDIPPQIGTRSAFWQIIGAANAGANLPVYRAIAGTAGQVRNIDRVNISPVQNSAGTTFYYKPPVRSLTVSGSVRTAVTAPDPDKPVANTQVTVQVTNGAGTVLAGSTVTTDSAGNYVFTAATLPDDQSLSVQIALASWSGSAYRAYVSNQSYPGAMSPSSAGGVVRIDSRTLRLTLAATTGPVSTTSNRFDLTATIPPPQGPSALDWKLFLHSRYDGSNVYVSDSDQITWPAGETLDWLPRITATPAPNQVIGGETYRYDTTVVAWSFVSSEGTMATGTDALGRSGCRARHQPNWAGGNASLLDGCAYFYDPQYATTLPMDSELAQQAHAFWGMQTPQDMEPWTYVYRLASLKRVELQVQALVKVQVVKLANAATGTPEQPAGNPAFLKIDKATPFSVNLVAPRSTR